MKKVLIVDDEPLNRRFLFRIINDSRIKIDFAENGLNATELWMEKKHNLVLMDINMPVMNGIEAARIIKSMAQDCNENPVIIAVTASVGLDQECINAGMCHIIRKPICANSLISIAKSHLGLESMEFQR